MNFRRGLKRKVFQVNKQFGVKCLQNVFSFPCLNENDLRALTLGVYQMKQAKALTVEQKSADGSYRISIHTEDPGLIRDRIQSHHVNAKKYFFGFHLMNTQHHHCQRKVGLRTVGCCAHVAAVLLYLGYQRHQTDEVSSETNYCRAVLDAADTDWDSDVE